MGYTYKILTDTDVPLFKHLLRVFGEAFEEPDTYQSAVPGEAYLRDLLGKEHFYHLLAVMLAGSPPSLPGDFFFCYAPVGRCLLYDYQGLISDYMITNQTLSPISTNHTPLSPKF